MSGPEAQAMARIMAESKRFKKPELVVDGVVLLNGADLTPQPVAWLWRDWLALGKLHILAGAPGQGKTTIAISMAATVTSGGRWPDGSRCERGHALIWSGEETQQIPCCHGSSRPARTSPECIPSPARGPTASCSRSTRPPTWCSWRIRRHASGMFASSS